jgi:hypothetical protein
MRAPLASVVLFTALPAHADPDALCNAAQLGSVPCATSANCVAPVSLCTRDFNQQLHHAWAAGHCIDPTGGVSASAAIQADFCTIPDPKGWGAFTPYHLPAGTRLKLDDPELDGAAVVIFKRIALQGDGASLAMNGQAVIKYAGFRVVIPLQPAVDGWSPPTGDKYAAHSILRDLAFESVPLNHANQNVAILVQANGVKTENIRCWDPGVCVHVNAPGGLYNANHAASTDTLCAGDFGACTYINGADANDFLGIRFGMSNGPGLLNSGFLQNHFIQMSCETCGERFSNLPDYAGQYISILDEGSSSSYDGGYLELGDPFVRSTQWSTTFFGSNWLTRITGPHERFGGGWSRGRFSSPGSPYELWLGRSADVLLFQTHANDEGIPIETYAWQLKVKMVGSVPVWGIHSEDNFTTAPWSFRGGNVLGVRGRAIRPENTQILCCDGVDNDEDGLVDFEDNQCDPNTMEC